MGPNERQPRTAPPGMGPNERNARASTIDPAVISLAIAVDALTADEEACCHAGLTSIKQHEERLSKLSQELEELRGHLSSLQATNAEQKAVSASQPTKPVDNDSK